MVEYILLPLIGLLIALFGVFYDAKKNPKNTGTILLVSLLVATTVFSGWSTWAKNRKSELEATQATNDKNIVLKSLSDLAVQLGGVKDSVDSVGNQVSIVGVKLGIRKDNQSPEVIYRSLQANEALSRLGTAEARQNNERITVQFFPKELDRDLVQGALLGVLSEAGFSLKTGVGNPSLSQVPTNSIWYGSNVPDSSVRTVALALTRAGLQIKGIQPFDNPGNPARAKLIQIGSYVLVQSRTPYSVDQINTMAIPR